MKGRLEKNFGYPTAGDLEKFLVKAAKIEDGHSMPFLYGVSEPIRVEPSVTDCGENDDYHMQLKLSFGPVEGPGYKNIHKLLKGIWTLISIHGVAKQPVILGHCNSISERKGESAKNENSNRWMTSAIVQPTPWEYPRHYGLRFHYNGEFHGPIQKNDKEKARSARWRSEAQRREAHERMQHARFLDKSRNLWDMTDEEEQRLERHLQCYRRTP